MSRGFGKHKVKHISVLIGILFLAACSSSKGLPPVDPSRIDPRLLDGSKMAAGADKNRIFAEHALSVKADSVLREAKSSGVVVGELQSLIADLIESEFSIAYFQENEPETSAGGHPKKLKERPVVDRSEQGIALRRAAGKLHTVFYEAKIAYFSGEEVRAMVNDVVKKVYGEAGGNVGNPGESPGK